MAIATLAGPATGENAGTANITTASFTPPDKSYVVLLVSAGWCPTPPVTVSITDSGSHTWTKRVHAANTVANNGGLADIWTCYFPTSPGAITVTATFSSGFSGGGGGFIDTWVLSGCDPVQTGSGTASSTPTSVTDAQLTVATTRQGSWVLGLSDNSTHNDTWTPNANTNTDIVYADTTDNIAIAAWVLKNVTGAPGNVTYGGSWATAATTNNAALEILPAVYGPIQIVSSFSSFH